MLLAEVLLNELYLEEWEVVTVVEVDLLISIARCSA
jgi:hypothetical protein